MLFLSLRSFKRNFPEPRANISPRKMKFPFHPGDILRPAEASAARSGFQETGRKRAGAAHLAEMNRGVRACVRERLFETSVVEVVL